MKASVVPFLLGGDNDAIDGLTMTSDNPYPVDNLSRSPETETGSSTVTFYWPDQQGRFIDMGSEQGICYTGECN